MTFTSATIQETSDNYNTVILYNREKVVYKCSMTKLESADFYCKYKNVQYIK